MATALENLHCIMDESAVPYKDGENPFPFTDKDDEFMNNIIKKFKLEEEEGCIEVKLGD